MGCIVAQLTYKVLFAIYQYVGANAFNCYILCKHLSLLALGLGFAVARAHPRGLLRPRKERGCYTYCSRLSCISLFCSVFQSSFCSEQAGVEPAPPREKH